MEKKQLLTIGAIVIAVLLLVLVIFLTRDPGIEEKKDSSNVKDVLVTQCLEPLSAYKKINSGECVPIYEDKDCFKSGKVEVLC